MNERIAEIMWECALPVEEAKVYAESTGQVIPPTHVLNVAKFAELIVQECLDIAKNWDEQLVNAKLVKESNAVGIVAYRIARQFGVEE
jgi:hypothetical protein